MRHDSKPRFGVYRVSGADQNQDPRGDGGVDGERAENIEGRGGWTKRDCPLGCGERIYKLHRHIQECENKP